MADAYKSLRTQDNVPDPAENLYAGDFPRMQLPIVVVTGEVLVRGTVLGKVTASGKYAAYDNAASDGTEVAAGILCEDVDATDGDVTANMYVTGAFKAAGLTGDDAAAIADLHALNCYVL
jgi:hypothetical protein